MMLRPLLFSAAAVLLTACGPKSMTSTPETSTPSPMASPTAAPTASPSSPSSQKIIDYGEDGISLQKPSDVDKLVGAPEDFKTFIAGVVEKETAGSDPSDQCAPSVGVGLIDPAGFASGGISDCGGAAIIWAKKDGTWKQLWGGQMQPDCDEMKAASVPKVIEEAAGEGCFDKAKNDVVPYQP